MVEDEKTLVTVAAQAGVSPDAIRLIYCVFNHLDGVNPNPEDNSHHLTAADLCDGLISFSQEAYGEAYAGTLRAWGLDTSEKLGHAIHTLAEFGWVRPGDSDDESDFRDKFDLST